MPLSSWNNNYNHHLLSIYYLPGSLDAILHVLHLIGPYDTVVLTTEPESESPGDVKTQIAGPHPRVSDWSGARVWGVWKFKAMLKRLIQAPQFENPTQSDRHWYSHFMGTEMGTREVTGYAWGATPSESEPAKVCPCSHLRPMTTQTWETAEEKEETYFEMTAFLPRKKERKIRKSTAFRARSFAPWDLRQTLSLRFPIYKRDAVPFWGYCKDQIDAYVRWGRVLGIAKALHKCKEWL